MEELLLVLGAVTFLYALVSARFDHSLITPPMVFTAVGVVLSFGLAHLAGDEQAKATLEIVAELTLVVVLFIDASRISLPLLIREYRIPVRMLAIGLPLTVLLGAVVAKLLFNEFSMWEAALVAAILAPTDAALGQAVVSSPKIPVRIRQSLNVESGLNDGIILPAVMLFAALAAMSSESGEQSNWLLYWIEQVTLGPLVGVVVGFGGGYLLYASKKIKCINENFLRLSGIALAIVAWAGALSVGGNGFIAAFVAGMCISGFADNIGEAMRDFGEAEGQLLGLATFLLFGMIAIVPAIESADAMCYLYAVLSLTLIRMVPVGLAMIGLSLHWPTIVFLGWFGPRGLATLLFGLLVIGKFELVHDQQILTISVLTVVLSMIAHGVSAVPGARWYSKMLKRSADRESLENQGCQSHRDKFTMQEIEQK